MIHSWWASASLTEENKIVFKIKRWITLTTRICLLWRMHSVDIKRDNVSYSLTMFFEYNLLFYSLHPRVPTQKFQTTKQLKQPLHWPIKVIQLKRLPTKPPCHLQTIAAYKYCTHTQLTTRLTTSRTNHLPIYQQIHPKLILLDKVAVPTNFLEWIHTHASKDLE